MVSVWAPGKVGSPSEVGPLSLFHGPNICHLCPPRIRPRAGTNFPSRSGGGGSSFASPTRRRNFGAKKSAPGSALQEKSFLIQKGEEGCHSPSGGGASLSGLGKLVPCSALLHIFELIYAFDHCRVKLTAAAGGIEFF